MRCSPRRCRPAITAIRCWLASIPIPASSAPATATTWSIPASPISRRCRCSRAATWCTGGRSATWSSAPGSWTTTACACRAACSPPASRTMRAASTWSAPRLTAAATSSPRRTTRPGRGRRCTGCRTSTASTRRCSSTTTAAPTCSTTARRTARRCTKATARSGCSASTWRACSPSARARCWSMAAPTWPASRSGSKARTCTSATAGTCCPAPKAAPARSIRRWRCAAARRGARTNRRRTIRS